MKRTGKLFKIKDVTYELVWIDEGEWFEKDDLNCITEARADAIVKRAAEDKCTGQPWSFGSRNQLSGYQTYAILRPHKEPEMNEFGTVTP